MSIWQPIQTAPRDGTEVLAMDTDGPVLMAWHDDADGWCLRANGDWDLFDAFAIQYAEPTAWMPIPPLDIKQ